MLHFYAENIGNRRARKNIRGGKIEVTNSLSPQARNLFVPLRKGIKGSTTRCNGWSTCAVPSSDVNGLPPGHVNAGCLPSADSVHEDELITFVLAHGLEAKELLTASAGVTMEVG